MTIEEEIKKVEYQIFLEEMADFMNWSAYYRLKEKLAELKKRRTDQ